MNISDNVAKINDFMKDFTVKRRDEADGKPRREPNGEIYVDINMSTAFSWMIQAAGRCKYYASDVLYDIDAIKRAIDKFGSNILDGVENCEFVTYIAVRDMGVDSNLFISNKIDKNGSYRFDVDGFRKHYSAVFRVTITEAEIYGEKNVLVLTEEFNMQEGENDEVQ